MQQIGLFTALAQTKRYASLSAEARERCKRERFAEIVRYATAHSPYYRKRYEGLPPDFALTDLPPVNKLALMDHFDEWVTDRAVTRDRVTAFMRDLDHVGCKLDGKYLVYTTSGSTGNPAVVLYDKSAMSVASAVGVVRSFARAEDMRAFLRDGGRSMGLFADHGFYLGTGSIHYNLKRMPWKRRQLMAYDVRNPLPDIVETLNRFQPSMLGSYPTALELLIDEQMAGRLHISPVLIMSGGEYLSDAVRAQLEDAFRCTVQTNYSCTEGGTVACECTERHFHINEDWTLLEAVDEQNRPVPDGVQSDKVLLTNFANHIQPFIRYEINDRVTMHHEPCACGNPAPWLTLEGRTDEILTFPEGRVAPLALYVILKEIPAIRRFQIIQQADGSLVLRLLSDDREAAFAEAHAALRAYLDAQGIHATIALSAELPAADAHSGKFRHVFRQQP